MKSLSSSVAAFAGGHADDALAAAALGAIAGLTLVRLMQAGVGEGDDDAFVGDEVFDGDFAFVGHQLGQARRGVFFLDVLQFGLDDGQDAGFLGQDVQQVLDAFEQLPCIRASTLSISSPVNW